MSDTVKLIIEIPKDYYEVLSKTEVILTSQRSGKTFMSVIYSAVKNGIPLDNVTSRISDLRDSWERDRYEDEAEALNVALRYIDEEVRKHDYI